MMADINWTFDQKQGKKQVWQRNSHRMFCRHLVRKSKIEII